MTTPRSTAHQSKGSGFEEAPTLSHALCRAGGRARNRCHHPQKPCYVLPVIAELQQRPLGFRDIDDLGRRLREALGY